MLVSYKKCHETHAIGCWQPTVCAAKSKLIPNSYVCIGCCFCVVKKKLKSLVDCSIRSNELRCRWVVRLHYARRLRCLMVGLPQPLGCSDLRIRDASACRFFCRRTRRPMRGSSYRQPPMTPQCTRCRRHDDAAGGRHISMHPSNCVMFCWPALNQKTSKFDQRCYHHQLYFARFNTYRITNIRANVCAALSANQVVELIVQIVEIWHAFGAHIAFLGGGDAIVQRRQQLQNSIEYRRQRLLAAGFCGITFEAFCKINTKL